MIRDFEECQNKTDEELVELILKDHDYFICLMKRYDEKLIRYIVRISGIRKEDAEDLLQEIFIKVFKNLYDFDTKLKFSSWIYRIARNHTISSFRKAKSHGELNMIDLNDEVVHNISSGINIEKNIDSSIIKESVGAVLRDMDLKYREVLVLRYIEEKDYKEISDILKKPIGTVATLINRAKKQFKSNAERNNIKF